MTEIVDVAGNSNGGESVNVVNNPEENKTESAIPSVARIATQSAYTEAEAKDEVVAAARAVSLAFDDALEVTEDGEAVTSDELDHAIADLDRALSLVDTYKGVR